MHSQKWQHSASNKIHNNTQYVNIHWVVIQFEIMIVEALVTAFLAFETIVKRKEDELVLVEAADYNIEKQRIKLDALVV